MAQGFIYSRLSKGGRRFTGLLENVSDPENPAAIPLTNISRYIIRFLSPSKKVIERNAGVNPTSKTSDDNVIYFDTTADDPIFDEETGYWEYTIGIERDNGQVSMSPYREGFHVVE